MIWLAWRQFRVQAYVAIGLLAAVGAALGVTGPALVHAYDSVVRTCATHADCGPVTQSFEQRDHLLLAGLTVVVIAAPALVGAFWGAPLIARELENRTYRLAWTQSVTRARWVAVKLALVGLASVAAAGLLSLMLTWWASPLDTVNGDPYGVFDSRNIVPVGYAAFAFALGVMLGVLIRRTVPAMAATLAGFAVVRLAFIRLVRFRLIPPLHRLTAFRVPVPGVPFGPGDGALNANDYIVSEQTIDRSGHVVGQFGGVGPEGIFGFKRLTDGATQFVGVGRCPNTFPVTSIPTGVDQQLGPSRSFAKAAQECVNHFDIRNLVTYQPISRYWGFQWYEMSIYLVLALLLAAFSWWWVRRRLS
jgi:ABC-type transport system involved in multi-copper enzyme maturation permease subunit